MGLNINWTEEYGPEIDINNARVGDSDESLWLYQDGSSGTATNLSYSGELPYSVVKTKILNDCFDCGRGPGETMANRSNIFDSFYHDGEELYEVPFSITILLTILNGGVSFAALVGNTLVLWIVTVSKRMRNVTNLFIGNLATADIIIGLFTIPFQFQAALLQRWNLPDFMCAFCPFVQVLSVNVSVFTLSAIAVDRYKAVVFPLSARVSKRKAGWAILLIWVLGFTLAVPQFLDYKVIYIEDYRTEMLKPFCANVGLPKGFRVYYTIGVVVFQYFFPLVIITLSYLHMAVKLWGATAPGNSEVSRDAVVLRNKKKVTKMLAVVVLLFALCWLPLQSYNFLQTIFPAINEYQYINIIWFCSHWLAMSNSCCNPFIYAIYNDKFQREFHTKLWWLGLLCNKNAADNVPAFVIDKSNIRATYRFTNPTRPLSRSSIYNNHSVYGGNSLTRTMVLDSPRDHPNANNDRHHLSPSPIPAIGSFSMNDCRTLAVDRPRHFHGGHGSLSCGSSTTDLRINRISSHSHVCDSYFHLHPGHLGSGIDGESSTSVMVNYDRNGMISTTAVPSNSRVVHNLVRRYAATKCQIEVDVCHCDCDRESD